MICAKLARLTRRLSHCFSSYYYYYCKFDRRRCSVVSMLTSTVFRSVRCVHFRLLPAHRKFYRRTKLSSIIDDSIRICRPVLLLACVLLLLTKHQVFCRTIVEDDEENNNSFSMTKISSSSALGRKVYTNQWAVRLDGVTSDVDADRIAAKYGFINNGRILHNYYSFTRPTLRKRSIRNARHLRYELAGDPQVTWIEQQVAKRRVKRDFIFSDARSSPVECTDFNNPQCRSSRTFQSFTFDPNDPEWINMWYLNRRSLSYDHNVKEAWSLGVTGKDVVVTILDDGLEIKHPDIEKNYDPQASYDINQNDADPTPRYDLTNENRHGTRCAGEVAAEFNNSMCIVGVAFQASIGGIKMLDGEVTDIVEAQSLSHNRQHVHIYSASWGPDDDGKTVDGPAKLASLAFKEGVELGRGGKGSIFVWASGNGGRDADSCNCDGYTNSIYTLSISSATENGNVPWYSEACSSTVATTYSSGSHGERMIVTTDLHFGCTNGHTGTSASAPLAAGICALALHANPNLTWRDLQHIVIRTAKPDNLKAQDWAVNGVGRNVSHSFGYGLMDAGAMVRLARNWTSVPRQKKCSASPPLESNGITLEVPSRTVQRSKVSVDSCGGDQETNVVYLEHVQARVTLSLSTIAKRGDIQIFLTSPRGTRSTLLAKRARDTSKVGFRDWAFMTTHNWGEPSNGEWTLEIQNDAWGTATLQRWELVIYGTSSMVGPFGGNNALYPENGYSAASVARCCSWTPLNLCAGCTDGYALYQNRCVQECPPQYYLYKSRSADPCGASSCRLCSSYCNRCTGPSPGACTECSRGYSLFNDKCVKLSDESFGGGNGGLRSVTNTESPSLIVKHYEIIVGCTVISVMVLSFAFVLFWYLKRKRRSSLNNSRIIESRADRSVREKNCMKIFCNNWILAKLRKKSSSTTPDNNSTGLSPAAVPPQPWSTVRRWPPDAESSSYPEARL